MFQLRSSLRAWIQSYFAKVLAQGPVPEHIAFVLDGNRRWAKDRNLNPTEGHRQGALATDILLPFLVQVGVKEVTLYTFSIENFKRAQVEVDFLMDKFEDSLEKVLQGDTKKYRMVGNRKLFRESIQKKIAEVEEATKNNTEIIVNVAMGYTCRDDIAQGIRELVGKEEENFSPEDLGDLMYTQPMKDVDIFVRTSGETRFSDFLMWESGKAMVCFLEKLWPDLNYLDMAWIFLKYQTMVLGVGNKCLE